MTTPPDADTEGCGSSAGALVGLGIRYSKHGTTRWWRQVPADHRGISLPYQLLEADAVADLEGELALLVGVKFGVGMRLAPVDATGMGCHCLITGYHQPPSPRCSGRGPYSQAKSTMTTMITYELPGQSIERYQSGNALLRMPELTQEQVALVEWMVSTPDGRRFLADVVADARAPQPEAVSVR